MRFRFSTPTPLHWPPALRSHLDAPYTKNLSSRARTTSIPISPRDTRSRSSINRSRPKEHSTSDSRRTASRSSFASRGCTWKKMRASQCTIASGLNPQSISIAREHRWWRSSLNPTFAHRPKPARTYARSSRFWNTSMSPTLTWRRVHCVLMSTFPRVCVERRNSAPAPK